MKQLYFLILLSFLFSCKKETVEIDNSGPLEITFTGSNSSAEQCTVLVIKSRVADTLFTEYSNNINSSITVNANYHQWVTVKYEPQNATGMYYLTVKYNGKPITVENFSGNALRFRTY